MLASVGAGHCREGTGLGAGEGRKASKERQERAEGRIRQGKRGKWQEREIGAGKGRGQRQERAEGKERTEM
ncbi:hypothetical protein Pmani_021834 [Petrolisthes manimaculis]|uniref:Uncharacterized protein n=1 Tax=Petrolisthes manimaculis TaxID=1843537 RepID=A0AAE1U4W5_9EUCA|nr:hypothetical protein Pmani_021834 [Petrolisthes manimaculis]